MTGAIQAAVFGWVPVLLWVLIGGIFFGAVTDFGALYASVKNDGKSMGLLIEKYVGKLGRKLFLLFCWLFTLLVIAAFADMVAGTFNAYVVADGVASLSGAALGLLVAHPSMNLPAFTGFHNDALGDMFPILFVTVACGAVSGFHSLVSSGTSSKTVANEKDMLKVGYGAMVLESLLAVLALCVAGLRGAVFYDHVCICAGTDKPGCSCTYWPYELPGTFHYG